MVSNPYTPPSAVVEDVDSVQEFQPVKLWSANGRVGRLRYLAYSTGASLIVGFIAGFATAVLGPAIGGVITLLAYIPLLVLVVMLMIQRSHDMNWSGWTVLLGILIPFVGLIWLFKPGTAGANKFGAPPPPNTTAVKILGLLLPAIFLIGLMAAIAIPAYQDYTKRAQAAQQQ